MDPSNYKSVVTSRGLTYHYFHSQPSNSSLPTLLFSHGFPSTSYDWHRILSALKPHGYGFIVPDQLGYGGTSKPDDPEAYRPSLISRDIADILDAEGIEHVIAIGHDWGSKVTSRFINFFPERVIAAGFLALHYLEPNPTQDINKVNALTKQMLGYELLGYQVFLGSEVDAPELITNHWDSLKSIIYPHDPKLWATDMAPLGAIRAWLTSDRIAPLPSYLSQEDLNTLSDNLKAGGITAPLNWYKIITSGIGNDDDKKIPKERYAVPNIPVFFGAATNDFVCLAQTGKDSTKRLCTHSETVIKEYAGDHWVLFSHANEIAADLHDWIKGLSSINESSKL